MDTTGGRGQEALKASRRDFLAAASAAGVTVSIPWIAWASDEEGTAAVAAVTAPAPAVPPPTATPRPALGLVLLINHALRQNLRHCLFLEQSVSCFILLTTGFSYVFVG